MTHVLLYWDLISEGVGPVYMLCGFIGEIEDMPDGTVREDPPDLNFIGDGGVVTLKQLAEVTCEACRARAALKGEEVLAPYLKADCEISINASKKGVVSA